MELRGLCRGAWGCRIERFEASGPKALGFVGAFALVPVITVEGLPRDEKG